MPNKKRKYIFIGDIDSINVEIICNSHNFLKTKLKYIIICNKFELCNYIKKIKSKVEINEIFDPINFSDHKINSLNIYNIDRQHSKKYKNLLNQLDISNGLSNSTGYDLITMPIDKSIFKKNIDFIGVTEYLGKINNTKTAMLMHGEKFSVLPITTHINIKNVHKFLKRNRLRENLEDIMNLVSRTKYGLDFNSINFLCYNPHCGEMSTLGKEDSLIRVLLKNSFKKISGPIPADSAFNNVKKNTLFISTYHDQALIPFKILNKKGVNFTLGLNYRRFSPTHGTAKNIKFKNKADNSSYLQCMLN